MRIQSWKTVLVMVIFEVCASATNANVVTYTERSNETSSYDHHPPTDGSNANTFTEDNIIGQVLNLRGAAVSTGWMLAVLKVVVLLTLTKLSSNVIRTSMKNIDFPYLAYHQLDISSAFEL